MYAMTNHRLLSWMTAATVLMVSCCLQVTSGADCTLNCPNDAPCQIGAGDFSAHTTANIEQTYGSMHCGCPYGWTGVLCDHKYETCDNNHKCYHGGECVPGMKDKYGNDQLFCDCSNAVMSDGTKYVGKYCETPFEKICDDEGNDFCVNGGDCNPEYPTYDATPCLCPDGWEGKHCEFKRGSVPACTLDCRNEGVCEIGIRTPAEAEQMHHIWSSNEIDEHMQCLCLDDYGGPLCEAHAEICGDDICYHGGTCVETEINNSGVVTREYHCDCTTASDENSHLFAGKYCQHESTQFCSETDENLFCTNGGTCNTEDPFQGCDCPDGWNGFKCEFKNEQYSDDTTEVAFGGVEKCGDVYCFNNGQCITTEIALSDGTMETQDRCDCSHTFDGKHYWAGSSCQYKSTEICSRADNMFCVHSGECPNDNSFQCSCPDGWQGEHCEIHIYALEDEYPDAPTCGDNDRVCLNGGTCTSTQVIMADNSVETEYHCDCSQAFDDKFHYAGVSCQFPSSQLCTTTSSSTSKQDRLFCTNHGQCREDPEQGCKCPAGFEGFSCEFENVREDPTDRESIDFGKCGDDLVCHNDGVCVTTLLYTQDGGEQEIHHCDCSTAATETTAWAGDMCQHEATKFCTEPMEGLGMESAYFCVNHGECNVEDVRQGCDCPTGWNGLRCEFQETAGDLLDDTTVDNGSPCGPDMTCYNSGNCEAIEITNEATGDKNTMYECNCAPATDGTYFFAGPQCEYRSSDTCSEQNPAGSFCVNGGTCKGGPLEGCECPAGWTGFMCDVVVEDDQHADKGEECGNGYCYNGGSCVETKITTEGGTITEFHCSCAEAFDDEHRYGGISCEHKSTTFCSRSNQGDSLAGVQFCANGGTCDSENPQKGCDCPAGWTGMGCEFQTNENANADDENVEACGDLACLNGGKCVTTTTMDSNGATKEMQHCDCSTAYTDNDIFAGTQCEYKQTSFCSEPGASLESANFCTNGGTCKENILSGCDCHDAFTGFRCEYQKDTDYLVNEAEDPQLVDDFVECGDDYCYNGGTCVSYLLDNGQTDYKCSCDTAATDSTLYAGKSCQYEMTSLCTKGTLDSLASADFCVNNGKCPDTDEDVGCSCPSGYVGYRCDEALYAHHDNEDNVAPDLSLDDDDDDSFYRCRLQCQNGGVCAKGAKDLTHHHEAVDHVAHLNQTYDETYFEHCICKAGWFGLECEHKAEVCGADEHLCLHGSKCVKSNDEHGCDCSQTDETIDGAEDSLFAGDSCQHPATDICTYGNNSPGRPLYFCTNHGTCNDYVSPSDSDPGCGCPTDWTGPHCEIRVDAQLPVTPQTPAGNGMLYIIGGVCLFIGIASFSYLMVHRRSNKDPSSSCIRFRRRRNVSYDPTDQSNNLAPKRTSAFSAADDMNPPPSRTFSFRSGSDPMTAFALPPDSEPPMYRDEPRSQYRDEAFEDEPDDEPGLQQDESVVLVDVGPATDEDGNQLHSVDFL